MPVRIRNGASSSFSSATMSSCWRRRSASRPWATVSRGLWSVRAQYGARGSMAASAISRMGAPPSDQSEWLWQSPWSRSHKPAAAALMAGGSTVPRAARGRRGRRRRPPRRSPARSSCRHRGSSGAGRGHGRQLVDGQLGDGAPPHCGTPGPCRTRLRRAPAGRRYVATRLDRVHRSYPFLARLGATRGGSSGCLGYSGGHGASAGRRTGPWPPCPSSGCRDCGSSAIPDHGSPRRRTRSGTVRIVSPPGRRCRPRPTPTASRPGRPPSVGRTMRRTPSCGAHSD